MLVRRLFRSAVDDAALGIERPSGQLADGAQPPHLEQSLARDEPINVDLGALVHLADPDKAQIALAATALTLAIGSSRSIWSRMLLVAIRNGNGMG